MVMEAMKMTKEENDIGNIMTSISIKRRTRQRIRDIGSMGRTYDDVLDEILTFWEENH